jgi:lactobin A/cerein 7B family class IIb bacteriocin
MVSRLKHWRIEMNMPIAEAMDSELRVLSDNELDDVNGGFLPLIGAAIAGAIVGSAIGYVIARGIVCMIRH